MKVTNAIDLLPNNEYSLQKIVKAFQQGNKNICYTSGVGTGKSYIFMKLVYDYYKDKKVLYIVPKYAVSENIRNYKEFNIIENNVEFETYNYFNNYEKGMLRLNDYDLILIDECHHLGSNIYGTILTKCMHDSSIPCLGLTATPIREDGIDILSYFDTTIKGMTTIEAIKCGYMKPFNYRICLPKDENSLNILMHDITDTNSSVLLGDKRTNVKSAIDYEMSEDILKEIVKQYPKNKWTIFCDKIDSLNEHLPLIHRIFPDYKIYPLHSKIEEEDYLQKTINKVSNSEKAVVVCCDMFTEGIHIDDMDGIMFFRNVQSLPLFQQMLGRVCKIGKTEAPIVVDCTSCGPRILFEMIKTEDVLDNKNLQPNEQKEIIKNRLKVIMNIGLDKHQEWEGFDEFLNEIVKIRQKKIDHIENVKDAANEYFRMFGTISNTDKLLRNCAELWDVSTATLKHYIEKQEEMER